MKNSLSAYFWPDSVHNAINEQPCFQGRRSVALRVCAAFCSLLSSSHLFGPSQQRNVHYFHFKFKLNQGCATRKGRPPRGLSTVRSVYTFWRKKLALIGPAAPQQQKKKRGIHLATWLICIALKKTGSVFSQLRWQKQEDVRVWHSAGDEAAGWLVYLTFGLDGPLAGCTGIALMYKASHQMVFMKVLRDTTTVKAAKPVDGWFPELKNKKHWHLFCWCQDGRIS